MNWNVSWTSLLTVLLLGFGLVFLGYYFFLIIFLEFEFEFFLI